MRSIVIAGCGSWLPNRRVSNDEVERLSGYSRAAKGCSLDAWAQHHHGGKWRHWVESDEATSDLALRAARGALDDAGVLPAMLDLVIVSTFTSDHRMPSTASRVQAGLQTSAKFLQLDSACTGFIDAMWVATSLMRQHKLGKVLIVAADILSRLSDPKDFLPQTVFGDGGAAAVLEWHDDPDCGVSAFSTGSDGQLGDYVLIPAGGSRLPITKDSIDGGQHYWRLQFHEIRKWALQRMSACTGDVVSKSGIEMSDVSWFVPHQASVSIIRDVAALLNIPNDKVIMTYEETGNTSGASIPLALDVAKRDGRFREGDWIVMSAVGAGMAWGALTYRWQGTG